MISRASIVRAFLIPCAMTLVLAGCSSGGTSSRTTTTGAKARIPAICKKYGSADEQQQCAGRWMAAQEDCKREETAGKTAGKPTKKFSLSKCITKKMNLASAAQKPDRSRTDQATSNAAPTTQRATAPRVAPPK